MPNIVQRFKRHFLLLFIFGLIGTSCACVTQAAAGERQPLTVVLDSGHNPGQPGALGVRGVYEIVYNDNLTAKIADALRTAGFPVVLTRTPTQNISLDGRTQVANTSHADLFLAIHHDSAQPVYLDKVTRNEVVAYRSKKPLAGYSIFVSKLNPQFADSYHFAEIMGQEMLRLGRSPAMHHAENIPGENRELLNTTMGIYRFDDLIVLKKTNIPAVLLEVGVIVDPDDEHYVSSNGKQEAISQAIVSAVRAYDRFQSKKR